MRFPICLVFLSLFMVDAIHFIDKKFYKDKKDGDKQSVEQESKLESYKKFFKESFKEKFSKDNQEKQKDGKNEDSAQKPVCPYRVEPMYEEEVVEEVAHSIVTVYEPYDSTEWLTETQTVQVPVTVIEKVTKTLTPDPIYITETKVIPEENFVTRAKLVSVGKLVTHTDLEIITYTATNTVTKTRVEPLWITLTEEATRSVTSTVPVVRTLTEWISQVDVVTQPVYITNSLWLEAPRLHLVTTTEVHPHYMTTTEYVTKTKVEKVCKN